MTLPRTHHTPPEPRITINGTPLSDGQAMTIRVACGDFLMWLNEETRDHPDTLLQAYRERMVEVVRLLQGVPT